MRIPLFLLCALGAACADPGDGTELDGVDDDLAADGKTDVGTLAENTPDAYVVLQVANRASQRALVAKVGLGAGAAGAIVATRLGDDGVAGTQDDVSFRALHELDRVAWVGPRAFERLRAWGKKSGYGMPDLNGRYLIQVKPAAGAGEAWLAITAQMTASGQFIQSIGPDPEELVPGDADLGDLFDHADFDRVVIDFQTPDPRAAFTPLELMKVSLRGAIRSGDLLCGSGTATDVAGKISNVSWAAIRQKDNTVEHRGNPLALCK